MTQTENAPAIILYSMNGVVITHGKISSDMWLDIKRFSEVSKQNPQKITFVSMLDNTILNFFESLVCSPHGTEFTVIYSKIDRTTYMKYYGRPKRCPNQDYYDANPYIPEECSCEECVYQRDKINELHEAYNRLRFITKDNI